MIGLSGFGYRRKARQFTYKPVFWNEEQDARTARDEAARLSDPNYKPDENYVPGSIIRAKRQRRLQSSVATHRRGGSTIIRVALFLGLLVGALYFLTDFFTIFAK